MKLRPALAGVSLTAAALLATPVPALAAWTTSSGHAGLSARAAVLPAPATPSATAHGSSVRVTWSSMTAFPVRGYRLTRTNALTVTTVEAGSHCGGLLTTPACTEGDVPPGSWSYAVLAVVGDSWTSASVPSAPIVIGRPPPPAEDSVARPPAPASLPAPSMTTTPSPSAPPSQVPSATPSALTSAKPSASPTPSATTSAKSSASPTPSVTTRAEANVSPEPHDSVEPAEGVITPS